MRKTLLFTLLSLLGVMFAGCTTVSLGLGQLQGSGNVTTEQRDVGAFTAIDVAGVGEVMITQGDADGLTVETDDNIQAVVLSEVRDDTLHLSMQSGISLGRATRMRFTITVRNLAQITLAGAATVSVGELNGDLLSVDHAGAGSVTSAGTVNEQRVTLSGAGSYDGAALVSDRATVDLSGLGNVVVQVRDRLDATVSGAGNIEFIGNPELHNQISGLGSIRQRAP